jgi:hypothetical protein
MKYSPSHRSQSTGSGRSGRLAINPYCIEDTALTPRELARARATDTRVIVPR